MNTRAVTSRQDFVDMMSLRNGEGISAAGSGQPVAEAGTWRGWQQLPRSHLAIAALRKHSSN